jgi:FlaA1/EpsC-like NDP-sugar epimerase
MISKTLNDWLAVLKRRATRYGPIFMIEVIVLWAVLEAVDRSGYGRPSVTNESPSILAVSFLIVLVAMGAGEARTHLYRREWSVASINDAFAVGIAVIEADLLITIANLLFPDGYRPFRVLGPVIALPAAVIAIGLVRLAPRLLSSTRPAGNRLLVIIHDAAGYATVKALLQQPRPDWIPVGIATTGPADIGRMLMGVTVLGSADQLPRWVKQTGAQGVAFVQTESTDRGQLRRLYAQCLAQELPVFIVPTANEWFPSANVSRLRQLSADDLVGREHREIDLALAAGEIRDRTVLVTGAAGSIGSELCRLLAAMAPRRMVLVDTNESGLFDLAEEVRAHYGGVDLREALVSIVDRELLRDLFADERPDVVFHAAAYKHVPMLESHPIQAVLTNVIGTWNTLRCAHASGVKKFILISTDKAATKHSVMGCTKRLCEEVVLAYRGPVTCWAVRFGNVVGSRGSVVPLFERQIEQGGPVTITHPDVSRYMMTIREAASLVLFTLSMSRASHLYMLDMGEPIKIIDLAHDLIRSRGLRPGTDIKIVFTGLRPGDRLSEELLAPDEGWRETTHPAIREVISPPFGKEEDLAWTVERLETLAREGKPDELVRALKTAVHAHAEPVEEPPAPERAETRTKDREQA